MKENAIIGVDLGGTNMRAGRVADGHIAALNSTQVPLTEKWEVVLDELIQTIQQVWTDGVQGIGIGVPGLVDASTGVVYDLQNIPSWKEVAVGSILSDHFKVPVYVNNDANCFAAGERFFGAGKACDDFVGLITGTGLGAGIIKWGRLLQDQNCGSGEFGMLPYLDSDYEHYCSGQFFSQHLNREGSAVAALAATGNKDALAAFDTYGQHLANVIKCILFTLDPAAIIIGGSVSQSYPLYEQAMMKELSTFPYSKTIERIKIIPSDIKDVAILGAAALFLEKHASQ
jgi:glucokinase